MDTIFAVSSGPPPAAIAVIRISGDRAFAAVRSLCGTLPSPRRASLRRLVDPSDGTALDSGLVIVFPAPNTATGEDVAELHIHGGRAVVSAVQAALSHLTGLRQAEPGEFTRRALGAGIIDLTEAEGLGDLLAAETETQRRAALLSAEGGLRRQVEHWLARLLALSAQVEAQLDFSDEDDVPGDQPDIIAAACRELALEIGVIADAPPVERLKDGVRVVLAGPPNSGKSTLLNALVGRDAAIVSSIAGTTRDRIDASVSRQGIAFVITDTAGLALETNDPIEAIGIDRAHGAMRSADVVVWLGDTPSPQPAIWIHPRADQPGRSLLPGGTIAVSAATGQGLAELWQEIESRSRALLPTIDQLALNERQRDLVFECRSNLLIAGDVPDLLVVAENLRGAREALGQITGSGDTEAMLDALFGQFCIGK